MLMQRCASIFIALYKDLVWVALMTSPAAILHVLYTKMVWSRPEVWRVLGQQWWNMMLPSMYRL